MQNLLEGLVEFKKNEFEEHKELFTNLGKGQNPHTLFIGCSDSRVVPNMITKTLPGELFMIRNIGNIVPVYRQSNEFLATTSAIEYAIQILNVGNIIVCGHSNCGACAALYWTDEELEKIPHTRKWLELSLSVKEKVLKQIPENDLAAREWLTEQINIVEQIKHLFTYPFVKERYQQFRLNIHGWHYIIETGEIYDYKKEKGYFELIN
jgi:carbonic anhydrase